MSRRRRRIVGVQSAAVALLVVLVYMTLLRPDGPGLLGGVEVPGGGSEAPAGPKRAGPARPDPPGNGPTAFGGAGATAVAAAGAPGATGAAGGPAPLLTGTTPADDQYADPVKALLDKVATGGSVGE